MTIKEILETTGVYASEVKGVSMMPMLRQGRDTVILKKPDEAIKPTDVVLYIRKDGAYVLHRVLEVREDYYIIRGDNCIAKEYVKQDQIVGLLTSFYRDEKLFSCENKSYRRYIKIWQKLSPIRIFWKRLRRREWTKKNCKTKIGTS